MKSKFWVNLPSDILRSGRIEFTIKLLNAGRLRTDLSKGKELQARNKRMNKRGQAYPAEEKGTFPGRAFLWMRKRAILKKVFYLVLCLIGIQVILILLVLAGVFGKIPGSSELRGIRNPVATEVYTSDSLLMGKYYLQNREYLEPGQITDTIRDALVATEDARFYRHHGIDPRSLGRVFFKSLLLGRRQSGGGSTLTQQLAKNLYPRKNYGWISLPVNKLREAIIALKMEKIYSKEEILEIYLSTVPFGENTYGLKSACTVFFNKEPGDLSIQEAALLVGMLKGTGTYNPLRNEQMALERRNLVLRQMVKYGYLDPVTGDSLENLPIVLDYTPLPYHAGIAPYFREHLRPELEAWCRTGSGTDREGPNLYTDGLKIYTTVDSRLQAFAEEAVRKHMAYVQGLFDRQWEHGDLWDGITGKQLFINSRGDYSRGLESEPVRMMKVFTWDGTREKQFNTLDSLRHYLHFLQAGFLAMDVRTGQIKAWVGGINHEYFQYDHVTSSRQTGSTFKPLVYLDALQQGIDPCEYFPNDSVVYHEYEDWTPRNADRSYGGYYSLKGALIHSVNTVSVELLMKCGIDSVIALGRKAGIKSPLPGVPSLALGTADISLLEMVGVYQAIANGGLCREPYDILRIEDKDGKVLYERPEPGPGIRVCSPENAALMTEMLRRVVDEGTAVALRRDYGIREDVAGKTGTTQNYTDGWFIGYSPSLVAGAWVGGDLQNVRFRSMQYGQGAFLALPIWAEFMSSVYRDDRWGSLEHERFEISDELAGRMDCDDFRDKKPLFFRPFKALKQKGFLRRLFKRNKNN